MPKKFDIILNKKLKYIKNKIISIISNSVLGVAMKKAKSKIIILSVMIFVMLATFGISVFAIKTQAVDVHTQILISDKGQAKSHVVVSDFVGPSNNSKFTELSSKPTFEPILEKNKDEDSKKETLNRDVEFSYTNYYRYYIMEVQITNLSTDVELTYTLNLLDKDGKPFVFSSQVETLFMQSSGDDFVLTSCESSGRLALGETKSTYIVFNVLDDINLWDLATVKKSNFTLKVEVSA